jgi:hypothetical protein
MLQTWVQGKWCAQFKWGECNKSLMEWRGATIVDQFYGILIYFLLFCEKIPVYIKKCNKCNLSFGKYVYTSAWYITSIIYIYI